MIMAYSLLRGLQDEQAKIRRYELQKERKSYQDIISDVIKKREKKSTK